MKVGVVDYGVGNLGSILRALEELRVTPVLVNRAVDLHATESIVLPGVGSFFSCMKRLEKGGWINALREEAISYERPLLAVCLGMQLLADSGTEGSPNGESCQGLGLVSGCVKSLRSQGCTLRVPHVGWNSISHVQSGDHLFNHIPSGTDFYFVHSFGFVPAYHEAIIATVDYGVTLTAAVRSGNIWGTQFHPEKSSRAGFRLLKNFLEGPDC